MQQSSFIKLMEGAYDNNSNSNNQTGNGGGGILAAARKFADSGN